MSTLVFSNAKIVVNSVDLSDHANDVTLQFSAKDIDATAFSSSGWEAHLGGLKSGKVDVTFNQDYAAGSVDATLFAALGTSIAFTANPVNAANSATNPQYQFNMVITDYNPSSGKVGDMHQCKISGVLNGAVTRATA